MIYEKFSFPKQRVNESEVKSLKDDEKIEKFFVSLPNNTLPFIINNFFMFTPSKSRCYPARSRYKLFQDVFVDDGI